MGWLKILLCYLEGHIIQNINHLFLEFPISYFQTVVKCVQLKPWKVKPQVGVGWRVQHILKSQIPSCWKSFSAAILRHPAPQQPAHELPLMPSSCYHCTLPWLVPSWTIILEISHSMPCNTILTALSDQIVLFHPYHNISKVYVVHFLQGG